MTKSLEMKINCMVVDDDDVSRSIVTQFVKKTEFLHLSHACNNAIEAHSILQKDDSIQILLLDIEMPEMSGLDLVENLPHKDLYTVLITSKEKYAVEAFEHQVTDYLIKPITYPRFLKAISQIVEEIEEKQDETMVNPNSDFLFVRVSHKIVKINPKEIYYIEALSDYILIYVKDQKHVVHSTMKGIEKKLEIFKTFVRVHRSYIVNIEHIESVQDIHVLIKGKSLPIGRSYKNKFIEKLDIL